MMPLDVLQQFHSEDGGDQEMETILLKAGAVRSMPSQFASRNDELEDFFKYKKGRDKPSDVRTALLTVAGLMLAATYQAALSPPSGLWQENKFNEILPIPGTPSLASPPSSSRNEHKAGTSILASRKEVLFIVFVFGNSIGFYTAIYTIIFLTSGFPLRLELRVSMLAIATTYVSAMYGIIPGPKTTLAFVIFSSLLAISLAFILKLLRKMYYMNPITRYCVDLIKIPLTAKVHSNSQ
ncbi:hypothetical protein L6164_000240 [Bauhinia variegata]|uniref:Uncharacterized protein n=1 Tax=Bauhinia variegata TaxID=167791 RepID=A0ACB9Q5U6_BAUVA|nr:hypothetical protein L6164_000240 [Bauhinia variegata]